MTSLASGSIARRLPRWATVMLVLAWSGVVLAAGPARAQVPTPTPSAPPPTASGPAPTAGGFDPAPGTSGGFGPAGTGEQPPDGQGPGGAERGDRHAAAAPLFVEIAILVEYEAFDVADDDLPTFVAYIWEELILPPEASDEDFMDLLGLAEFEGRRGYLELEARGIPVDDGTVDLLEVMSDDDFDSVFFFDTRTNGVVSASPEDYDDAVEDLVRRPADVDVFDEVDAVLDAIDVEDLLAQATSQDPDEPDVEQPETEEPDEVGDEAGPDAVEGADDGDSIVPDPAEPEPAGEALPPPPSGDSGNDVLLVVLGGLAGVLVLAVVVVAVIRRQPAAVPMAAAPVGGSTPSMRTQESVTNLLDVSRQLSAASDPAEVQELAVKRGVELCRADAGAFIVRGDAGLLPGYQTDDQLVIGTRLADGVIQRVVDTGQSVSQVSQTEPSLSNLPVSLAAVPVIAGGSVMGVLLVLRNPSRPFQGEEVEQLDALAPVIASTFETARKLGSMEELALVDGLTSLANRRRLDRDIDEVLAAAMPSEGSVAVVMIDVDHFKNFNDTQGHAAGDEVLRRMGRLLSQNVRPGDTAYRYGGEEFALLLPGTDEVTALAVATRVRAAIANESMPGEGTQPGGKVTASLGVAAGVGRTASDLFEAADACLYRAKESGRNRVVVESDDAAT